MTCNRSEAHDLNRDDALLMEINRVHCGHLHHPHEPHFVGSIDPHILLRLGRRNTFDDQIKQGRGRFDFAHIAAANRDLALELWLTSTNAFMEPSMAS